MEFKNGIPGIFHVHSVYSRDSQLSLSGLRNLCETRGYNFVILSDHAEDNDEAGFYELVAQCKRYSDTNFLIIPGLEFAFENMHILAFGITEYPLKSQSEELLDDIHEQGGLAVLAHARRFAKTTPYSIFDKLDGIEIWNMKFEYDGRLSPHLRNFRILKEARLQNKQIFGYGGLDLHWGSRFPYVSLLIFAAQLDISKIITALREGDFLIKERGITIDPSGEQLGLRERITFGITGFAYDLLLKVAILGYRLLKSLKMEPRLNKIIHKYF